MPAEELVLLKQGGDYGWPFCYFDGDQQKRVLAPEYGGDGGKAVGLCNEKLPPVAAFPAHWAPNDVKVYNGSQFPQTYRGGAFIAFHGSWNRSSGPQGGYNVVFQPLAGGKASGKYTIFADGFAGEGGTTPPSIVRRDWLLGRMGRFMSATTLAAGSGASSTKADSIIAIVAADRAAICLPCYKTVLIMPLSRRNGE